MKPEAFYGLAGDVVRLIEPYSEADPAALLMHFLVMFGNLVGRSPRFMVGCTPHHTNLFAAIVGLTSCGRKGTAYNEILHVLERVDPGWAQSRQLKGLASPEALIYMVRDEKRDAAGDIVDPGVGDKRLLVLEPEFSRLLRLCQRPQSIFSAVLRDAHDNGDLANNRTGGNAVAATAAHVSLIGHITPEELRRDLTTTEMFNGFANRHLFVCAQRSKLIATPKAPPDEQVEAIARRTREAAKFARTVQQQSWSRQARELYEEVYRNDLSGEQPGLLGAATGRGAVQVVRLSLTYSLLDKETHIKQDHLRAALAVWKYCCDSARFLFGDSPGDPEAASLLGKLRGQPEGRMTRNEVYQHFHRHKATADIEAVLGRLQANGLIRVTHKKEGNFRPTTYIEAVGARPNYA